MCVVWPRDLQLRSCLLGSVSVVLFCGSLSILTIYRLLLFSKQYFRLRSRMFNCWPIVAKSFVLPPRVREKDSFCVFHQLTRVNALIFLYIYIYFFFNFGLHLNISVPKRPVMCLVYVL